MKIKVKGKYKRLRHRGDVGVWVLKKKCGAEDKFLRSF